LKTKSEAVEVARDFSSGLSMAGFAGFYFGFRDCLTFLFFQSAPQTGTMIVLALNLLLLILATFYSAGPASITFRQAMRALPIRFAVLFLVLSFVSLSWTEAQSRGVAFGYWTGIAAEVFTVLVIVRATSATYTFESLIKGFIWGTVLLSTVGWLSPQQSDMRIGNDDFFSPNIIGFQCALAIFFCQYLAPLGARWKYIGSFLVLTLARSLSKTSIIAFLVAEAFYLYRTTLIGRWAKISLIVGASSLVLAFSGFFLAYYNVYINAGNQASTLTGRTDIWLAAIILSLEEPWLGHGFHSFHTVAPLFGDYQAWHAHNELLQQFFTYGVTGVLLVCALYWSLYRLARQFRDTSLGLLTQTLLMLVLVRGSVDTDRFDLSLPLWLITIVSLVPIPNSNSAYPEQTNIR
jgi:exopolysaccharide production protein ExoQ